MGDSKKMSEEELRDALQAIQQNVASDAKLKKQAKEYITKHGTLTEADLYKCFTI